MKPEDQMAIPNTLEDFQLMLDFYGVMNHNYPSSIEVVADDYYVTFDDWASRSERERNLYLWLPEINNNTDWLPAFRRILTANTILDRLPDAPDHPKYDRDNIKGNALFVRAYSYYSLAQLYAQPYDPLTAETDLGLPLRLDSDFNRPSVRSSVEETYRQVIQDLTASLQLLPTIAQLKTQPSKPAAYGALAKVHLAMRDYEQAGLYADSCLMLHDTLMDFNALDTLATAPIPRFNEEVIYHARSSTESIMHPSRAKVDSILYASFSDHDLRKKVYFRANPDGSGAFKGDYDGNGSSTHFAFWGVVTDEMYLIRAEYYARSGDSDRALQDLNTLLKTRWKKNEFIPFSALDASDALQIILAERRKELLFRATRWTDLRRLAKETQYSTIPERYLGDENYQLYPNSPRYTLFIPAFAIDRSEMHQNP